MEKKHMARAFRIAILAASLPLLVTAAAATTPNAVCHPVHRHHMIHAKVATVHYADTGLGVTIDQARLVAFPKPVKTVFVGNPTVVDVSMIDSQHAFLLGKTFGVTNMIALAADGDQISNQQVTVLNNGAAVTINRGADQFNYMCTHAHCETAPRPGDPAAYVSNTESTATSHSSNATGVGTSVQAQAASN
jgi:Pilus formation protein N terminal region